MDYGYQLLRHVVQQVFGNLGQAARLTLLLTFLPTVFLILTNPALVTMPPEGAIDPSAFDVNWGLVLLGVVLGVVAWCWAAVGWHRFVLLEEYPQGVLPAWNGVRIRSYLGAAILVGLVVIGAMMVLGFLVGLVIAASQSGALGLFLGTGLLIAALWVSTRIGLILPAAAVGEKLRISESWSITKPVSGQILLPIIVIGVVGGIASQLVTVLFGFTILGALVGVAVSWLQLLANLALMTTLYGNLVQGRALN